MQQEEKRNEVVITSYSQGHVLQQRMKEASLKHGDRVTADIGPVRLESNFGKMVMYFCPMNSVSVRHFIEKGDKMSLPSEVKQLEGISVPITTKPGLYALKNVQLFSNGTLQVIATADTKFEMV